MAMTPNRTVRIPGDEWAAATTAARVADVTLTEVIREGLRQFVQQAHEAYPATFLLLDMADEAARKKAGADDLVSDR